MNNILILEGPDRCGKTEIGKALSKQYFMSYFKNHREHENFTNQTFLGTAFVEAAYIIDMLKQVEFKDFGIIFDRHMPSEYVYSKVYNRPTHEESIWKIDKELADLGAVILYCTKTTYKEFEDEVITLDKIETIKQYYEEYFKHTKMRVIRLDTTDENLEREIYEIGNHLTW
jgi:thymidylate kinase